MSPDLAGSVDGLMSVSLGIHNQELVNFSLQTHVQKVFSIYVSSNNSRGFLLKLESTHAGKIVRYLNGNASQTATVDWDGNFVDYDLSIKLGSGGYLGFRDMSDQAVLPDSVKAYEYGVGWYDMKLPLNFYFINADSVGYVSAASKQAEIEVWVNVAAKENVFRGEFKDYLTCTIIDW